MAWHHGCRPVAAAAAGMTRNMRKQLKVLPSYGYQHPDCGMQPPVGVQPDQTLQFVLQLCSWCPAQQVCLCVSAVTVACVCGATRTCIAAAGRRCSRRQCY